MATAATKQAMLLSYTVGRLNSLGWECCGSAESGIFLKNGCTLRVSFGSGSLTPSAKFIYTEIQGTTDTGSTAVANVRELPDTEDFTWVLQQYGFRLACGNFPSTCYKLYTGEHTEKQEKSFEAFITEVEHIANSSSFVQSLYHMEKVAVKKDCTVTSFVPAESNAVTVNTVIQTLTDVGPIESDTYAIVVEITDKEVFLMPTDRSVQVFMTKDPVKVDRNTFVECKGRGGIIALTPIETIAKADSCLWQESKCIKREHPLLERLASKYLVTMEQKCLLNEALFRCLNVTPFLNCEIQNGTKELLLQCAGLIKDMSQLVTLSADKLRFIYSLLIQGMPFEHLQLTLDSSEMQELHVESMDAAIEEAKSAYPEATQGQLKALAKYILQGKPLHNVNLQYEPITYALTMEKQYGTHKVLADFLYTNCIVAGDMICAPKHSVTAAAELRIREMFSFPFEVYVKGRTWKELLNEYVSRLRTICYDSTWGFGIETKDEFLFCDSNSIFICDTNKKVKHRILLLNGEVLQLDEED